jgi:hypothetical protein
VSRPLRDVGIMCLLGAGIAAGMMAWHGENEALLGSGLAQVTIGIYMLYADRRAAREERAYAKEQAAHELARGIADARAGRTSPMGDYSKYAKDEEVTKP